MPNEAELSTVRQANERHVADYERRLAAEIVAMLPDDRDEARRVLAFVAAILNLPVEEPRPPAQGDELGPRQPSPN
jgi:hypothetical protein